MVKAPGALSDTQTAVLAKAAAAREGIALAARRGDAEAALAHYQTLRRAGQLTAEEWLRLGDLLDGRAPLAEVAAAYRTALSMNRGSIEARLKLAYGLVRLGRPLEALAEYDKGVKADPGSSALWANYGVTLASLGRAAAAGDAFNRALAIDPKMPAALIGRGNAKAAQARHEEAHLDFEKAFTLQPTNPFARYNYAGSCLRRGDWAQGFTHYEARWGVAAGGAPVAAPPGLWLGEDDIAGKTLLVDAEQGFGDVIQFCRFIPRLADRGAIVTVRSPRPLQAILQTLDPRITVVADDDGPPPRCDRYISMGSLPLACGATPDTLPVPPYLHAVAAAGRLEAPPKTGRRRIGVAWSGGVAQGLIGVRAVALQDLLKTVAGAGEVIALQKEATRAERALLAKHGVAFFGDQLKDFADTAALAVSCDLVISIDTSVAHLASGLGLPTWILLPFFTAWPWAVGERTPWYPNARLWRQTASEDWSGVLAAVKAALLSNEVS
jgi:tetratricopeptide (TPR) repeat protein